MEGKVESCWRYVKASFEASSCESREERWTSRLRYAPEKKIVVANGALFNAHNLD